MTKKAQWKYNRSMKMTAVMLMLINAFQLAYPNFALALTSGPTQPEVQGFEPVGTTDMVDMFSGSFVYNIPLLDVEGYPVNISYHGGVTMEEEASWVGLGWNINPGVINRSVRGVPDDFNGDTLYKDVNIKPEVNLRLGVGANGEILGKGDPDPKIKKKTGITLDIGASLNISNYRGVSCDLSGGLNVRLTKHVSAGVNLGVGSQTGASIDLSATASSASSDEVSKEMTNSLNGGIGGGYSSRSGLKDLSLSVSVTQKPEGSSRQHTVFSGGGQVPIGLQNFVPVITNSSVMVSELFRIKGGLELFGIFSYGNANAMLSVLTFENDASRGSYGYMYLQNAETDSKDILDFTRDKDGMFNKTMSYLPVPNMTYDVYNVSGQGTGGMFRPFRNDFGSVHDPKTESNSEAASQQVEGGLGNAFEAGLDLSFTHTEISSGPWEQFSRRGSVQKFRGSKPGSLYEHVYFKQGGELTVTDSSYYQVIGGFKPIKPQMAKALPGTKPGADANRDVRASVIYYHTNEEADLSGVGGEAKLLSHQDFEHRFPMEDSHLKEIKRTGVGAFQRKKEQIGEIIQVQPDGRKYVYGLAALNNAQKEVTFAVEPGSTSNTLDLPAGTVTFDPEKDATSDNDKGLDHFCNSSVTPSYAHSYLLTAVLSEDYVDVTGDGLTDDDLGNFTKFKYTRTDSDYRWVAPFSYNCDVAQYNPGFWSDRKDDRANFTSGSREQWNLHSIETKNYISEFYISQRDDARGMSKALWKAGKVDAAGSSLFETNKSTASLSYKLDSIKLYNKHDRYVKGIDAIPMKSVYFEYDYSLCPGVPNSISSGKLSLKKIYFSYGNSRRSMISPYQFTYGGNYPYSFANKNRWGGYKLSNASFTNYEFPYVDQNDPDNNDYSGAWSLTEIGLPSGGTIKAEYESNEYAFVQDKPVNEMFMVQGLGISPNYSPSSHLYVDQGTPCLYAYFKRRPADELPGYTIAQNYLGKDFKKDSTNCMYFNFNVQLTNESDTYEQIKGYADVEDVGACPNDSQYGYIKFANIKPARGASDALKELFARGCRLNPVTFTALNTARYNLPQVIFPGQDPDRSQLRNVIAGLVGAFDELLSIGKNPVLRLVEKGGGKKVALAKSFVRLQSVGLHKKGGGQRVKVLKFIDNWDVIAGGNEQRATYGKEYDYSIVDPIYGVISSGVASYEPLIGGDENPLRQPVQYSAQSGSKWPPMDPVDLYQETPIGESLFPAGQVGYSSVKVVSIHKDLGRSSNAVDRYEFYTARDYPAEVVATNIDPEFSTRYSFFDQTNTMTATQGYSLIFNDMHGRRKKEEHGVYGSDPRSYKVTNYKIYHYKEKDGRLDNNVDCFVHQGSNMRLRRMKLGVEEDITLDTREKQEITKTWNVNANLNFFFIFGVIPIPVIVPFGFPWENGSEHTFKSAVVTKVIQQSGILESIESYDENAKTIVRNEIYDPMTGQAIVTSVNNEFKDKEYTTSIPAWWAYGGMSGSYSNIGYRDEGSITVDSNYIGTLHTSNTSPLYPGDYLSVSYNSAGHEHHTTAWVMGTLPVYSGVEVTCEGIQVLPHFPRHTDGWVSNSTLQKVKIRVISSGHKNMLAEQAQSYTSTSHPTYGGSNLSYGLSDLIDIKAKTFSDWNTSTMPIYTTSPDSVNPYAIGARGQWRLLSEYEYHADRAYGSATSRTAGLFSATSLFNTTGGAPLPVCSFDPHNYLRPIDTDPKWRAMRTITKWSPFGKEVENKDAIGNYSTAVFSYNEELPVAVAANARQGEILSLGFEDYNLLCPKGNAMLYRYFPGATGTLSDISVPGYQKMDLKTNVVSTEGHTGLHSLYSGSNDVLFHIPLLPDGWGTPNYNNIFWSSSIYGYHLTPDNVYLNFGLWPGKRYILNYWVKSDDKAGINQTNYSFGSSTHAVEVSATSGAILFPPVVKTNIIDGWQQVEVVFDIPVDGVSVVAMFPQYFYIDDIRIFPATGNMKAFVYGPVHTSLGNPNEKLMATLDENNFATKYEYDQEGNLVRVKKETVKGIMTVSESRKGNPKRN